MENFHYDPVKSVENDCRDIILEDVEGHKQEETSWKPFLRQLLICSGAWLVPFLSGLSMGSTTVVVTQLRNEAKSEDAVSMEMSSWLAICGFASSTIWAIPFTVLMKRIGRKKPYTMANIVMLIGFIIMYYSNSPVQILISEFFKGAGLASNITVSIFIITEYTLPKYRGIFLALKITSIVWGIWVANAIGKYTHWTYIPVTSFICFSYNVTLIFWPESPIWLATRGEYDKCSAAHRWVKGTGKEAEKELKELIKTQKEKKQRISNYKQVTKFWNIISKAQFYKTLLMSNLILLMDTFSGGFMFLMYGVEIMTKITKEQSSAHTLILIQGAVGIIGIYIGSATVKFVNRRTMLISTSASVTAFLFMLSLYFFLIDINIVQANFIVSLFLMSGYTLSNACGPLILCFSIYGELIPLDSRTTFSIFGNLTITLINVTGLKVAPYIFNSLSLHFTFLLFGILASVNIILFWMFLPETKDKTLVEIQSYFTEPNTRPTNEKKEYLVAIP